MRKIAGIGLLIVVAIVLVLLLRQHIKIVGDRNFSHELVGAWSREFANVRETFNFAADGGCTGEVVDKYSKSTNTEQTAGTWRIKDGKLITTITNDSNKRRRVPRTGGGDIVRIDEYKCVIGFGTNIETLDRVTQ